VTLAWQLVFLVMGGDPMRYRPLMLPAIVEKLGWGVAVSALVARGRTAPGCCRPRSSTSAWPSSSRRSFVRTRVSREN
jgi:hypothetical protein